MTTPPRPDQDPNPRPGTNTLEDPRLRPFEIVTDVRLTDLDLDDLLVEVLDRVRELTATDTAAVLLVDASRQFLVATAARGLEAEVRQGVRIPLGRGFAGRIAAEQRPLVLSEFDDRSVVNPILRAAGIRSLLGVPLRAGGAVLGVLHVGTLQTRHFTDDDVAQLQTVGDRIALAVQSRLSIADRATAIGVQRSLWPSGLPHLPGLEFGARYVPAGDGQVGGDWYDVLALPSGLTWMVIGDVAGRGLPAALAMGRLRSALRAYALDATDPAELLRKLDRHLHYFDPDVMATVLCAVIETDCARVRLSAAGHPPPVVALGTDRPAAVFTPPADLPLGVNHTAPRYSVPMDLPRGATVCFYTDGLVEHRGYSVAAGIELLRRIMFAGAPDPVCAVVMAHLVADNNQADDVAILVVRRTDQGAGSPVDLRMPAVPVTLRPIRTAVRRWLTGVGGQPRASADLLMAIGEAVANSVEHAYGPRGGEVYLHLELQGRDACALVRDTGRWRQPRGAHRGRGTALMEGLSDSVLTERTATGTTVVIRKTVICKP
jgi:anti-sigma regulatory factor (Ser/Thr protein kinase)/putative methionine-R-sulfoxide reductase with GAF domain